MVRPSFPLFSIVLASTWIASLHADVESGIPPLRVTVVFKSGRQAKATVDSRTDPNRLWLQFGSESVRVTRTVAWAEVSLLQPSGQSLSRDEVLAWVQQVVADQASSQRPSALRSIHLSTKHVGEPQRESQNEPTDLRTRSIRFDAAIGNWDEDVEADGLMVQVMPASASGEATSIRGQLQVELWTMRRIEQDSAPHGRGRSLEVLQRWSVPVVTSAHDSPAWIKLPFQARHPEFDVSWSRIGLVHLELVVPGQGVFHHSIDGVRIRPYAPFRDALQVQTGERFLPTELNGRK